MSNIVIELFVPAVNECYDIFIPLHSKIYEIERLLIKAVLDLSDGYFAASPDTALCDRISGEMLDGELTPHQTGLHNGSKLLLL